MNFLAPAALAFSALSIPIVLMYMLRLRRTDMRISSNFLWQQLVRDQEANAPWQRLRFSWLLLLQLLILAALVLALARPYLEVKTISAGRVVVLLDASASMNAVDVEDGRFEQAKTLTRDIIDTLGSDDSMTLIRVGHVPAVLASSERSRNTLHQVLDGVEPGETLADWEAAFTLAAAGAKGVEDLDVVIISDGGLPLDLPTIPGEVRFVTVGEGQENLAISALATRSIGQDAPQLFARISNYGTEEAPVIFSLELDGELQSAQRYTVAAGSTTEIVIEAMPTNYGQLRASLSRPAASDVPDYLATDDEAFAVNAAGGVRRALLMSPRNLYLQQAFASLPGWELSQANPEAGMPRGDFDLYVFDGWLPPGLPDADMFILNPPDTTPLFTVGPEPIEAADQTLVQGVRSGDERTRYLDFGSVNVRRFRQLSGYEDWAVALVEAVGGPLLIAGEYQGNQVAVLSFALQDSDLPLQLAYPILISNLSQWYTPPRILSVADSLSPGTPLTLRPFEGDHVLITLPDGRTQRLEIGEAPELSFANTTQTGVYQVEVRDGDDTLIRDSFSVNLFSAAESAIASSESITVGSTTVEESSREEVGQRELWQYLVLGGLLLLLLEWLYYHRRIFWKSRPLTSVYEYRGHSGRTIQ